MGHSEPTSGIAGIMKAVLAIEHGIIPPTIGLKTLNPNSKSPLKDLNEHGTGSRSADLRFIRLDVATVIDFDILTCIQLISKTEDYRSLPKA